MGNVPRGTVQLKLLERIETAELFLLCGFDFAYAWKAARVENGPEFLEMPDTMPFGEFLGKLAARPELSSTSPWWMTLRSLYESGAAIGETLGAFSRHLRDARASEIERFARRLPLRLHLRLLVFFVPPTLFLLFFPMLNGLSQGGFEAR